MIMIFVTLTVCSLVPDHDRVLWHAQLRFVLLTNSEAYAAWTTLELRATIRARGGEAGRLIMHMYRYRETITGPPPYWYVQRSMPTPSSPLTISQQSLGGLRPPVDAGRCQMPSQETICFFRWLIVSARTSLSG